MVELRLLGTLELATSDGRDLSTLARQSKRTALLLYLAAAVPRGLHRRDTLLALFWPELTEAKARSALSQALYVLRNALGEHAIRTRGDDDVGIAPDVVWCDVAAFEAALERGQLEEALALYQGGLLNGFSLGDAPGFGRWVDQERSRLQERAGEAGWAWAEARAATGDVVQAEHWARWAAALTAADEVATRRLMSLLQRVGNRAAALRAYAVFAALLRTEYELEPSAETRALADDIRRQNLAKTKPAEPPAMLPPTAPGLARSPPRAGLLGVLIGAALMVTLGVRAVIPHGGDDPPAAIMRRLAVLPLQNLTGDSAQSYFVDGMHEALIDELAKVKAVAVISRTSVLQFRGADRPSLPSIAKRLGVDEVLEGSVFRAGDTVRLAVQLIDGRTDQHLWSETYLRDAHDVLRLYGELASAVAGRVGGAVTPAELGRLTSERQVDPEVYTLTFKGGEACLLWTRDGLRRGIRLLRNAVDRDPTYALAYARLAGCYLDMSYFNFMPDSEATPLAQTANDRALELDSTLGEGYLNRGWMRLAYGHALDGSDRDFRRALDWSPGSVRVRQWYSDYLIVRGRFDEAIDQKREAIALDPLSEQSNLGLGAAYFWAGRYDAAIAQLRRTLDLAPDSYGARMQLAWNYSAEGLHDTAVMLCDSASVYAPPGARSRLAQCGWVYARAGRRALVLELLRLAPTPCLEGGAYAYAALGDLDRALECLRQETRLNPQDLAFDSFFPMLEPLRADPRAHAELLELGIRP